MDKDRLHLLGLGTDDVQVIFKKDNQQGLPFIVRVSNTFVMGESSIPQFADVQYQPFFDSLEFVISKNKNIIIDFKLGYFNTKSSLVLKKVFEILNGNAYKCKPFVNWYYFENDERMLEHGEVYSQDYKKVTFTFLVLK